MSYILITNIYNEEARVKKLIENIATQSHKPECWVWIDDGSSDNGLAVAEEETSRIGMKFIKFKLPAKKKGNLDTIGRAWNKAHTYIISNLNAKYMSIADVDTVFPDDYFEDMIQFMEINQDVGVASGKLEGEEFSSMKVPMGGSKIVRWDVLQSFSKYWDLAPDSFLNIKAISLGYRIVVRDVYVRSAPMTIYSPTGRFRYGRRAYYVGRPLLMVLLEGIRFTLRRDNGSHFMRGFWSEWSRGQWRCNDPDILNFYSLRGLLRSFLKSLMNLK
ncbi:MAG: glycosyltransferase [Candidatus Thorarchaeota archaeon]